MRMIDRMFIGDPPGFYDKILDVSTAVTGSTFFVPSNPVLQALADPDALADALGASPTTEQSDRVKSERTDDSLGIGSLRRPLEDANDTVG
jgi:putative iron-dependent peroxidase